MKKFKNLIVLLTLVVTAFSCKKHVIEYNTKDIGNQAQFQLHYMVPVSSSTSNNIYRVEINGQLYSNNSGVLHTYNAIPSGAVGRFFFTKIGENNIKLYQGTDLQLVYDQNVTLTKGKQNIVVYDFDKAPIVIDNESPYVPEVTEYTGTVSWIRFFNFLYDTTGEPTTLKLQYQWQYFEHYSPDTLSGWFNLGKPVSFGEATDWDTVHVNKQYTISSGYGRINYRIRVIDQNGNDTGPLILMNSRGNMVEYSDWWTAYIGRRRFHFFAGVRTDDPVAKVRQFTEL